MGEATTLEFLAYNGDSGSPSRSWLPWLTSAELDPLQRMKDTFGSLSIAGAEAQSTERLRSENRHIYPTPSSVGWGKPPASP